MDAKKLASPTVEERLAKVERQNRRLKIAVALALVLMGAIVLEWVAMPTVTNYSTSDFKFRSAQMGELIVVDEDGTRRGVLLVTEGEPRMFLLDENGYVIWQAPPPEDEADEAREEEEAGE